MDGSEESAVVAQPLAGGGAGDVIVAEEMEAGPGSRKPKKMQDPKAPTQAEREEHELTHLPYRSWCIHCVKGRGKDAPHLVAASDGVLPEVHFDFAFMGDEGDAGHTAPMLVARVRDSRMTLATAIPRKTTGEFVVGRTLAFLKEVGIEKMDIIYKSDQEPAIMSVLDGVREKKAALGGRWIPENSPVGSHQSNGVVERAIQSVAAQVRVLKSDLETRWGVAIPAASAAIPWMMEWAAFLLNRYEVGHDGKTAYERCKGKPARTPGIAFGEAVLWRRKLVGGALGKLTSLWEEGVFLGIKGRTGELVVGDARGVWKTRTVQRRPYEERWRAASAAMIVGVPWRTSAEDEKQDGEQLEIIQVPEGGGGSAGGAMRGVESGPVPRRGKILRSDLQVHGYTAGCEGCKAALAGRPARAHSEACRKRMEEALRDEPRMREAQERQNEFISKAIEKQEEERKNKAAAEEPPRGAVPVVGGSSGSGQSPEDRKRSLEEDARLAIELSAKQSRVQEPAAAEGMKVEQRRGEKRRGDELDDRERGDEGQRRGEKRRGDELDDRERGDEGVGAVLPDCGEQEFDEDYEEVDTYDEKSGELLDPVLVRKARAEEVEFMGRIQLFKEASTQECWDRTGRPPISTKWVDLNKGTKEKPDVRCRLVARDFKPKGEKDREDLFAAMPPLEAKRLLFARAAARRPELHRGKWSKPKLMFIDIKKAHLNGKVPEEEFVFVEDPTDPSGSRCWRLMIWLHGMRPAASAWEADYPIKLAEVGLAKGVANPTVFHNPVNDLRCVVHGDDFTFLGWEEDLEEMVKHLEKHYELKVRGVLGGEKGDDEEITILNRKVSWRGR